MGSSDLRACLVSADAKREALVARLQAEQTDTWRVFHGSVEGRPGLTVDKYGAYLLAMVFWQPLNEDELQALRLYAEAKQLSLLVWERQEKGRSLLRWATDAQGQTLVANERAQDTLDRSGASIANPEKRTAMSPTALAQGQGWTLEAVCREQGQLFGIAPVSHGKDPYLFLDFRAGRRWLRHHVQPGQTVLNLFSYTCGAGVAAAGNGAHVVNVDFSRWCLDIGKQNSKLNAIPGARFKVWQEDVFPIIRQLSGLGVKGRAARHRYMRVEPQQFDTIILDPPTLANSPFGKVDLKNDYAAMFKPCLLSLRPGGTILATNHHSEVTWEDWARGLERTATKIGLPALEIERLYPEEDFPTLDGEQPLKMAIVRLVADADAPGGARA